MELPLRFEYSSVASIYVGATSAGTGAGTFKVAESAVDAGNDGVYWRLAGLKAGPAVARPCSNVYKVVRLAVFPVISAFGAAHVRSVENPTLFLKFVAISGDVREDVKNSGYLFAGAATVPAKATVLMGRFSSTVV